MDGVFLQQSLRLRQILFALRHFPGAGLGPGLDADLQRRRRSALPLYRCQPLAGRGAQPGAAPLFLLWLCLRPHICRRHSDEVLFRDPLHFHPCGPFRALADACGAPAGASAAAAPAARPGAAAVHAVPLRQREQRHAFRAPGGPAAVPVQRDRPADRGPDALQLRRAGRGPFHGLRHRPQHPLFLHAEPALGRDVPRDGPLHGRRRNGLYRVPRPSGGERSVPAGPDILLPG